jgi:predicted nucleotidyltransferase
MASIQNHRRAFVKQTLNSPARIGYNPADGYSDHSEHPDAASRGTPDDVFGSVTRGEAEETSDVDVLVEFDGSRLVGLFAFARMRRFLTEILGRPVDLATPDALREGMRE